jgi:hypothetical protein
MAERDRGPRKPADVAAVWWVLAAMAAAPALSCERHGSSPSEPGAARDSVAIESISPAGGSTLVAGSTVDFHAAIRYEVRESDGVGVAAQMQYQDGNLLANIFPSTAVPRGIGSVSLTSRFQIPASGASRIDIYYILYATPGATTEIVDATKASYPVGH